MSSAGTGPSKQVQSSHTSPSRIEAAVPKESIAKPFGCSLTPSGRRSAVLTSASTASSSQSVVQDGSVVGRSQPVTHASKRGASLFGNHFSNDMEVRTGGFWEGVRGRWTLPSALG